MSIWDDLLFIMVLSAILVSMRLLSVAAVGGYHESPFEIFSGHSHSNLGKHENLKGDA